MLWYANEIQVAEAKGNRLILHYRFLNNDNIFKKESIKIEMWYKYVRALVLYQYISGLFKNILSMVKD